MGSPRESLISIGIEKPISEYDDRALNFIYNRRIKPAILARQRKLAEHEATAAIDGSHSLSK